MTGTVGGGCGREGMVRKTVCGSKPFALPSSNSRVASFQTATLNKLNLTPGKEKQSKKAEKNQQQRQKTKNQKKKKNKQKNKPQRTRRFY